MLFLYVELRREIKQTACVTRQREDFSANILDTPIKAAIRSERSTEGVVQFFDSVYRKTL